MQNFTSISDTSYVDLRHALDVAVKLKVEFKSSRRNAALLAGKVLAMIFEKPSLRTRVSFSVAIHHLGGQSLMLRNEEVGLGIREPVQDIARVLSGMCDGIIARTFEHAKILTLARYATVPVINALTDYSHPCQAMADLMTIQEHFGSLKGRTIAFIGDSNNVSRSLAIACGRFGMRYVLACPGSYALGRDEIDRIMTQVPDMEFLTTADPREAVREADVLYTDTWISMGQESERSKRLKDFAGFCIDDHLLAAAPPQAIVMHCLPAYRGLEISESVLEGPRALIFQQAENRLHFQKGLLAVMMGGQ